MRKAKLKIYTYLIRLPDAAFVFIELLLILRFLLFLFQLDLGFFSEFIFLVTDILTFPFAIIASHIFQSGTLLFEVSLQPVSVLYAGLYTMINSMLRTLLNIKEDE